MDTLHGNGMGILSNSHSNILHSSSVYILLNNLPDTNWQTHTPSSRIGVLHQLTLLLNIRQIHRSLPTRSTLHLAQSHMVSKLCISLILNTQQDISPHLPARCPITQTLPARRAWLALCPEPGSIDDGTLSTSPASTCNHTPLRPLSAAELAESFPRHSCVPVPPEWEPLPPAVKTYCVEVGPKLLEAEDWLDDPHGLEYHVTPGSHGQRGI